MAVEMGSASYEAVCPIEPREQWLIERMKGIGGSDAATLLGLSRRSALSLYAEKIGELVREEPDQEYIEWGNRLEPVIAEAYADRTKRVVRPCSHLLRSRAVPYALATPDYWWMPEEGGWHPLEIKTTGSHLAWKWEEGAPPEYEAQLQWQMFVTGAPRASIACLIGGQRMVWCDVERDEAIVGRLLESGQRFWDAVQARVPPEPDGTDASREALHALYPAMNPNSAVALGGEYMAVCDLLEQAKEQRRANAQLINGYENALKAALQFNEAGHLPDGRIVTWKDQKRAGYTVKEATTRVLRVSKGETE